MKKIIILIIIIILFVFIFLLKGENVFFVSLKPFQNYFYHSKQGQEIEDNICRDLKIENIKLREIEKENEILRKQLDFLKKNEDNFILANIIGRKSEGGINWFLIDQGLKDGIKTGLAVVDENGVLVGKIIKVKDRISYLRPIFDQNFSLGADIISREDSINLKKVSEISGILQGEYSSMLKMKYVPLDKKISIGDSVVTSGLEEDIRWGISIGQIVEINKKDNSIFQELVIKPLLNPDFKIVSIILPIKTE